MISSLIIDGALKIVQIMRYGKNSNRPDVARLYNPRATTPEKVLECHPRNKHLFIDTLTWEQYKEVNGILTLIH